MISHVESKNDTMNLLIKQTHRHKKQTYSYKRGKMWGEG